MPDPRDIVDLSLLPDGTHDSGGYRDPQAREPRQWIGVLFECCNVYSRIHKTKNGTAYAGFCPRCNAKIRVGIGNGGTSQRIFRAS